MAKLLSAKRNSFIAFTVLFIATLSSCVDNSPSNYSSIKGSWRCIESSENGERTYLIDVFKSQSGTGTYLISNFHNVGTDGFYDITATSSAGKITINSQSLGAGQNIKSGSGTVNSTFDEMTINYTVYNNGATIGYTAVYTR